MIIEHGKTVEILMATYNGEKYIKQQIQSIQNQTFDEWTIKVSDDSSSDKTLVILNELSRNDPRIKILPTEKKYGGAKENFFHLIEHSEGDYILFCDQDDYWLPKKIEICLKAIKRMEKEYGDDCPFLISTDAIVADEKLEIIAPSFLDYEAFPHTHGGLPHTLVENNVWGCTIMCNRTLMDLAKKTKDYDDIVMHDWWLNLIATACGKTALIDEPTLKYRQHSSNSVGTHKFSPLSLILNFDVAKSRLYWKKTKRQAHKFAEVYSGVLASQDSAIVKNYLSLFSCSRPLRLYRSITNEFTPTGIARKTGQIVVFALSGKKSF